MFRYGEADDFGEPETAFNICTFWYINALAEIGRKDEARELFEEMLSCRTRLGLLSEDLDVRTGELWGNFPRPTAWSASSSAPSASASHGRTRFEPPHRRFQPGRRTLGRQVRRRPRGRHPRALRQSGGIWFGWGGETCHGEPSDPKLEAHGAHHLRHHRHRRSDFDGYYNGYCNGVAVAAVPLHARHLQLRPREHQDAYLRVNQLFARKLRPLLQPMTGSGCTTTT
jgi:pentatricopeptide repeat protein